jgi:coenzyme F420-dependent glucose-6-phosphate dehydrogenase
MWKTRCHGKIADARPSSAASRWIVATIRAGAGAHPAVRGQGFNHLVFHAPGADQARFMEYFSQALLPLLKRSFA